MYVCGLDIGQQHDHTAMAIAAVQGEKPQRTYALVHLERFPLKMGYVEICEAVCQRWQDSRIPRETPLLVDATGVGKPLCDWLRTMGVHPVDVIVTSGTKTTEEDGVYHVPKVELITTLQLLLGSQRLKIAASLPEAQTLVKELVGYRRKITTALHTIFGAWREGTHDDLLFAVGLACWYGERWTPAYQLPQDEMHAIWREVGYEPEPLFPRVWSGQTRERWRAYVQSEAQKGVREGFYGRDEP